MSTLHVNRIEHITFLRAIATIAVVFYHSLPSLETGYIPAYLITVFLNWCVPIFFMISGSLFFDDKKHISFKYILRKIFNIIKIIFVWGFVYNFISTVIIERSISLKIFLQSILMIFKADTTYCYQFWYLYVLLGIYLFIPLFKPWTDKFISTNSINSECLRAMVIFMLLSIILPTFCIGYGISPDVFKGAFTGFSCYLFYVLCGRLYECIKADKKYNKFFFVITTIFILQSLFFIVMIVLNKHSKIETWYGYHSFFTWNMASVLFLAVKKIDFSKINPVLRKIYTCVAKHSFSIYILHVIIIQIIRQIGFTNDLINPWLYPIINISIIISICIFISYIAKKIPVVKHLL